MRYLWFILLGIGLVSSFILLEEILDILLDDNEVLVSLVVLETKEDIDEVFSNWVALAKEDESSNDDSFKTVVDSILEPREEEKESSFELEQILD